MTSAQQPKNNDVTPWTLLSSSKALDEKWFMVRKDEIRLPSGKVIDDYFVWESPDIAVMVPYTTDGKFVLCEQYRHAINKVVYQFPAGGVGKNETPEQAAKREMEEETGYTSSKITPLSTISVYPTKLTGLSHLFLAEDATPAGLKQDDEMEPTRVVLISPQELWAMIDEDKVKIADSFAASLLALRKLGL